MHFSIELIILIFGVLINIFLLFKFLIRPLLWSTTNTFLCLLLTLNTVHLTIKLVFMSSLMRPQAQDSLLQGLDYLFYENSTTNICFAQMIVGYLYRMSTVNILLGILLIRFMLLRFAENIRTNSMDCETYQARLSNIGLILSLYILAFLIIISINHILLPFFPANFVLVIHCRGVEFPYSPKERLLIRRGQMIRMTNLLIMLFFMVFGHFRVLLTKSKRHPSCFAKHRQNIATYDQTLFAAYLKLGLAIVGEIFFHLVLIDSPAADYINTFNLSTDLLNCVVVPGYWLYSTNKHFKEMWSSDYILRMAPRKTATLFILPNIEPRRQPVFRQSENGRFIYGFRVQKNSRSYHYLPIQETLRENPKVQKIYVKERLQQKNDFRGKFFYGIKIH